MESRARTGSINDRAGGTPRLLLHGATGVASPHRTAMHHGPGSAQQAHDPALTRPARVRDSIAVPLTGRQQEVLALMAEGWSNAAIASRLFVTERAVIQHVSNIYDQLGLPVTEHDHRRVLAVLCYLDR